MTRATEKGDPVTENSPMPPKAPNRPAFRWDRASKQIQQSIPLIVESIEFQIV